MSFPSEVSGRGAEKERFKLEEKQNGAGDVESVMKCSLWNVRSLNNKLSKIMEYVLDRESDIVFLTETWLQSDANSITAEIKTYGYKLLHDRRKDRAKERGGGVGIMIKAGLAAKQQPARHFESFEHTIVNLSLTNKKRLILISIWTCFLILPKSANFKKPNFEFKG